MRVIAHQPDIVFRAERREIGDGREIAIHRKNAVRYQQRMAEAAALGGENFSRVSDFVVAECGLAELSRVPA